MIRYSVVLLFLVTNALIVQVLAQSTRWQISDDNSIKWVVADSLPHYDHIEMSGKYVSAVVRYGVNADQSFGISRDLVWPMLRTIPNDTHASLVRSFSIDPISLITVNKQLLRNEKVSEIKLNGKVEVQSSFGETLSVVRILFPSPELAIYCEKYELTNTGEKVLNVEIPELNIVSKTNAQEGVDGSYFLRMQSHNAGAFVMQPKDKLNFYVVFSATKNEGAERSEVENELDKRNSFLSFINNNLQLVTPDSALNTAFALAKIRAAESIFQTKGGPMHGPGGLVFYAAIWANDQAEYINPFFPFLGYAYGNESALNAYRHFARFMNPAYTPIPSSIIAEGTDVWKGAGDRGDAAMIAYGAARFCLAYGNEDTAEELWPLIEWCLEFNKRKCNAHGVVTSDSDELEGRFPAGEANLCTSSLYYDALLSAAYLGESIGKNKSQLARYRKQASALENDIDRYFGATMNGMETYRYYKGNDKLRSWICIPLTVDIFKRREATVQALFSPELWTVNGLASQAGDKTFWDRSTLYALRGVFAAGETNQGLVNLKQYTHQRFFGEHVPYPVEAYPEGNQRQLSAESGLYCRIFTEGVFGIKPVAFNRFVIRPQLPEQWNTMSLKMINAFNNRFDIKVTRQANGQLLVRITSQNFNPIEVIVNKAESTMVTLPSKN